MPLRTKMPQRSPEDLATAKALKQTPRVDACKTQTYVYVGEGLCMRNKKYYVVQQTHSLGHYYHQVGRGTRGAALCMNWIYQSPRY